MLSNGLVADGGHRRVTGPSEIALNIASRADRDEYRPGRGRPQ